MLPVVLQINLIFFWRILFFFPLFYSDLCTGRALFVAKRLVAGLEDVAMVRQPILKRGGHFGIDKNVAPFCEREVVGDNMQIRVRHVFHRFMAETTAPNPDQ